MRSMAHSAMPRCEISSLNWTPPHTPEIAAQHLGEFEAPFEEVTSELTVNTNSPEYYTTVSTYDRDRSAGPSVLHIENIAWQQLSAPGQVSASIDRLCCKNGKYTRLRDAELPMAWLYNMAHIPQIDLHQVAILSSHCAISLRSALCISSPYIQHQLNQHEVASCSRPFRCCRSGFP